MERNAHLFAVDLVPGEDDIDDTDESEDDSEPEEFDSKKAKLELEEYGDIDWKKKLFWRDFLRIEENPQMTKPNLYVQKIGGNVYVVSTRLSRFV